MRGASNAALRQDVLSIVRDFEVHIIAFDLPQALEAARLRDATRAAGAGIGDRACLALGKLRGAPVYTGDRRLALVSDAVGSDVRLIR